MRSLSFFKVIAFVRVVIQFSKKSLLYDYENDKNKTKDLIIDNYNKNNSNIKERIADFAKEFKVNTYYSNY